MQEVQVQPLGQEDPLEKETATLSSILAWKISMDRGSWRATINGVEKRRDMTEWVNTQMHTKKRTV